MVLTAKPHGALRHGFDLVDSAGATVAAFASSVWRENGQVRIGDRFWELRNQGSRRFTLEGQAGTLAVAERASYWSGAWRVSAGDRTYELVKPSWRSRRYDVRAGGVTVGELRPMGVFGSKAEVDLPDDMPPPVQVFVVAVVMTLWRREQNSAAPGTASN